MTSQKTLKSPTVLSFERKIATSDGKMTACNWESRGTDQLRNIPIMEKSVRGTISNRDSGKKKTPDPEKFNKSIENPNLQTVDVAALPFDCNTLCLEFSVRVLGQLSSPSACNLPEYEQVLKDTIDSYIAQNGFTELSVRYAQNIANARFFWRNRLLADSIEVMVKIDGEENEYIFNALKVSLDNFASPSEDIRNLARTIELGLKGEKPVLLRVKAFARIGNAQEIYPSQEMVVDRSSNEKDKSKYLYSINDTAAMHSQKIGNALRTIDTWYPEAENYGPIPVEPYGAVTSRGKAYRQPSQKIDFYSLIDNWLLKQEKLSIEQQHYVIAVLIRGGVFS